MKWLFVRRQCGMLDPYRSRLSGVPRSESWMWSLWECPLIYARKVMVENASIFVEHGVNFCTTRRVGQHISTPLTSLRTATSKCRHPTSVCPFIFSIWSPTQTYWNNRAKRGDNSEHTCVTDWAKKRWEKKRKMHNSGERPCWPVRMYRVYETEGCY